MKKVGVLLLVFTICFAFSCKHEPLLPPKDVSFHDEILPIVRASCQHSGCHDPADVTREFPLDSIRSDYDDYINPGKPKDSKTYERIADHDANKIMPQPPYAPLTDQQIELIYIWIAQGAKDN